MAAATHAQTSRSKRSIGIGSASGSPALVNAAGFQESRMCGDARSGGGYGPSKSSRPLPHNELVIVASGEREDGAA